MNLFDLLDITDTVARKTAVYVTGALLVGNIIGTVFGGFAGYYFGSKFDDEPYTLKILRNQDHINSVQLLDEDGVEHFNAQFSPWEMRDFSGWEARRDQTRLHAGYEPYHYDIATGRVGDISIVVEEVKK